MKFVSRVLSLMVLISSVSAHASRATYSTYSPAAPADLETKSQFFIGPSLGATSQGNADGSQVRDTQFSLGGEAALIVGHWMGSLGYKYFTSPQDGSAAINLTQTNNWFSTEAKYRIWDENFSPYVSAGLGALFQTVSTQVMGVSDKSTGTFLTRQVGLGLVGKITDKLGVNLAARYFQYSNVNGFDYVLTLGFFP